MPCAAEQVTEVSGQDRLLGGEHPEPGSAFTNTASTAQGRASVGSAGRVGGAVGGFGGRSRVGAGREERGWLVRKRTAGLSRNR